MLTARESLLSPLLITSPDLPLTHQSIVEFWMSVMQRQVSGPGPGACKVHPSFLDRLASFFLWCHHLRDVSRSVRAGACGNGWHMRAQGRCQALLKPTSSTKPSHTTTSTGREGTHTKAAALIRATTAATTQGMSTAKLWPEFLGAGATAVGAEEAGSGGAGGLGAL